MSGPPATPVRLDPSQPPAPLLTTLAEGALAAAGDVPAAVELARRHGGDLPLPGSGSTLLLWEALATLGATDLTVARVVEPHVDALAILDQARRTTDLADDGLPAAATWGVYAAEGPGVRVEAVRREGGWVLDGTKPWCSVAGVLSHALVTAWDSPTTRGLYAVRLGDAGVRPEPGGWVARGLSDVVSSPVHLAAVPAVPVGGPGWYLSRPGFAWGGIGVAAVWFGGAVGVARRLRPVPGGRPPDQVALMHLGACDVALHAARAALAEAARWVDSPPSPVAPARLALRVRQVVADAVETVLLHAAHGLGPGPLATEEAHARRVADLGLYVRQWHAERDLAALGADLLADDRPAPW